MATNKSRDNSECPIPTDAELEQASGGGMIEAEMAGKAGNSLIHAIAGNKLSGWEERGMRSDRFTDKKTKGYGGGFLGSLKAIAVCAFTSDDDKKAYLGE